jgi:aminoglycoside phosphotransferase (APT) family kinase protein
MPAHRESSSEALDRQSAFSGTRPVADAYRIDLDRLAAYLKRAIPGFSGPLSAEQFKGGQSNPTYKLTSPSGQFVLRRKPPGKLLPSAHAVDREFRVIEALHRAGFPVPRPRWFCGHDAVIGTPFSVLDFVAGRVFWEPFAPGIGAAERHALFESLNSTIAALHSFDPMAIGLGDFGRPEGYLRRQIRRWSEQYRASASETLPEMERLMQWLPQACPDDSGASVVHGDFRLDNCIIAEDQAQVVAVLDWELSTLGDPLADFTYHLMQWFMPRTAGGIGTLAGHENDPGIPSLDAYVAAYCGRTGRSGLPALDFYLAYNFFRLAAILEGIAGRVRAGTAVNANAAAMTGQVLPLATRAWAFAETAGA